jgi:hypothetical protein
LECERHATKDKRQARSRRDLLSIVERPGPGRAPTQAIDALLDGRN